MALLFVVAGFPGRFESLIRIIVGRQSVREYWTGAFRDTRSDFSLRDDIELADYLRQTTRPTDRVFVWGFEPAVNFLARRGSVPRFLYDFPMIANHDSRRFRAEFVRTYARDPAEVFVVEHGDAMPWVTGSNKDSYAFLNEFPELLGFLEANYHTDTKVGRFDLLRLNAVKRSAGMYPGTQR